MSSIKPVFLFAGGMPRNPKSMSSLLHEVFKESGKVSPTIAYVGTANDDSKPFFMIMTAALKAAGAGRIRHAIISHNKADLRKAQDILYNADIVYISGGDVDRGMRKLQEKNISDVLVELYRQGKPLFGMSAGSIMLAKEWIRWRDPEDNTTAEIFSCLGIAPVICDTHGEADNWEELQALLKLEQDNCIGYGIVTGTVMKVFPDGRIGAMGGAIHQYIRRDGIVARTADLLPD